MTAFDGPDFGCGPSGAMDQSLAAAGAVTHRSTQNDGLVTPESGAACDDYGVAQRCGPTPPNPGILFGGCAFMDMSEIAVFGAPY